MSARQVLAGAIAGVVLGILTTVAVADLGWLPTRTGPSGIVGTYKITFLGGEGYPLFRLLRVPSFANHPMSAAYGLLQQVTPDPAPGAERPIEVTTHDGGHFRIRLAPGRYVFRGGGVISHDEVLGDPPHWGCPTRHNQVVVRPHRWTTIDNECSGD